LSHSRRDDAGELRSAGGQVPSLTSYIFVKQ
jgi:hypothetical protein